MTVSNSLTNIPRAAARGGVRGTRHRGRRGVLEPARGPLGAIHRIPSVKKRDEQE